MRKLIIMAAAGLVASSACLPALAASPGYSDYSNPEARAYVNFAFGGASVKPISALHYGLRLDHDSRWQAADGRLALQSVTLPAITQLDFNASGFSSMSVNGVPFAYRVLRLNDDDQSGGGGSGSPTTSFTVVDWGLLLVGAAGVGYAIDRVVQGHSSPDH